MIHGAIILSRLAYHGGGHLWHYVELGVGGGGGASVALCRILVCVCVCVKLVCYYVYLVCVHIISIKSGLLPSFLRTF